MTRSWVTACVAAETVGIVAAAVAARSADRLVSSTAAGYALVVLGGLVEGTALGVLQARALPAGTSRRARTGWAVATLLVAGLGWAAGSAPATLGSEGPDGSAAGEAGPPLLLVLAGAALLGAVLGAVLGLAQGVAARLPRPAVRRWVLASTAGWTAAMPVVFVGASSVGADWSWPALVASGAATGAVAGVVLGLLTRRAVPAPAVSAGAAGAGPRPAPPPPAPAAP